MIRPMPGRVLVEVFPPGMEHANLLKLTLVDKKKHFQHPVRKGKVIAVGRGVSEVRSGEVVIFRGDAGFTTDKEHDGSDLKGEDFRWLKPSDCLAVEEREEATV